MKVILHLFILSAILFTSNQLYFELAEENERCYYEELYYQNVM